MSTTHTPREEYPARREYRAAEYPARPEHRGEERTTAGVAAGGSTMEALAGAGAIALAIIGLAGVLPETMAAIAAIAIGGALLIEGGALASRFRQLVHETGGGSGAKSSIGSGLTMQMLGGAAGIALGILALVGVLPETLLAVSALVFGGALLFGGSSREQIADIDIRGAGVPERTRRATRGAVEASGGALALCGVASGVLGVLALVGVGAAMTLILVAMLCVGGGILISGTAVLARAGTLLSHA